MSLVGTSFRKVMLEKHLEVQILVQAATIGLDFLRSDMVIAPKATEDLLD